MSTNMQLKDSIFRKIHHPLNKMNFILMWVNFYKGNICITAW